MGNGPVSLSLSLSLSVRHFSLCPFSVPSSGQFIENVPQMEELSGDIDTIL